MTLPLRLLRISACLLLLSTGGCISLIRGTARSHALAPNGLSTTDDAFRRALAAGSYAHAYERAGKAKLGAPDDALLRALYRGTTGYHAGEWKAAAAAFAEADRLTEQRVTRSLSRGAASLITNDRVLPYMPSRTERLFTRYYAMLSYLRADDRTAATVEARRLGLLLQATSDSIGASEKALHAVMRDAAGAVFESVGEYNDALVSYRNAALLRGATPQAIDSIAIAPVSADSATLVLFVESGFVAHRVSQELDLDFGVNAGNSQRERRDRTNIQVSGDAAASAPPGVATAPLIQPVMSTNTGVGRVSDTRKLVTLPAGEHARQRHAELEKERDEKVAADTVAVAKRKKDREAFNTSLTSQIKSALSLDDDRSVFLDDGSDWRRSRKVHISSVEDDNWNLSSISIAWPVLMRSPTPRGELALLVSRLARADSASGSTDSFAIPVNGARASVSDAVAADLRRAMPSIIARMVIRTTAKAKISDEIGEEYGWFAGAMTSLAANMLEVADTRSWQLLPAEFQVVRIRVPAGELAPRLQLGEALGAMNVDLPNAVARPGEILVTNARIWRDQSSLVVGGRIGSNAR